MRNQLIIFAFLLVSVTNVGAKPPNGETLYAQHCASCHGSTGEGGTGVPLALAGFQHQASDDFLIKTIKYGRPGRVMPSFAYLSDQEIQAIVKHLRQFSDEEPPHYPKNAIQGDITKGKQLFHTHCASCHGSDGKGGKGTGVTFSRPRDLPIIAPALNNTGFLSSASDHMIKQTLIEGRKGTPMVSFLDKGLSETQINDIVAYIRNFERYQEKQDPDKYKNEPMTIRYESPYDIDTTIDNIKRAAIGKNFRLIRTQPFEDGLTKPNQESKKSAIIYFCNFGLLNQALAVDTRVGLFLPCRITVAEQDGKVMIFAINPKRLSYLFNNDELNKLCQQMHDTYVEIIEEASL